MREREPAQATGGGRQDGAGGAETSGQRITAAVAGVTSLMGDLLVQSFSEMDRTWPVQTERLLSRVFTISCIYRVFEGSDAKGPSTVHQGSGSLI